jgi:hypothetical protein
MDTSKVAVATITQARSPGEEATLGRSLARLADAGLPIAVADRSSSPTFVAVAKRCSTAYVAVPPDQGLVAQVKASVALASTFGRPSILYVEPDKELFFEVHLHAFVRRAADDADVGIVVASRSHISMQTYPHMQRYTEEVINRLVGESIECPGDYSYGPFLMHPAVVPCLADLDDRLGWGWRHRVFLTAHRLGSRVTHVVGDYECPCDQSGESDADRIHRMRQLSQNILGLVDD